MKIGLLTEFTYPYTLEKGLKKNETLKCKNNNLAIGRHKISNFNQITKGDCKELKIRLQKQPIPIGIAITKLLLYREGVFN